MNGFFYGLISLLSRDRLIATPDQAYDGSDLNLLGFS